MSHLRCYDLFIWCPDLLRRWRGGWGFFARDGRMFFDVAGDGPFGEFCRIGFIFILHDGVENVQGDGGLVGGVGDAAGGSAL